MNIHRSRNVGAEYHAMRALLNRRFPKLIPPRGAPAVPMKVGVDRDMVAALGDEVPGEKLQEFLKRYTRRREYHEVIAAGGARFGLNGEPAGEIQPKESDHSAQAIAGIDSRRQRLAAANKSQRLPALGARREAGSDNHV